MSAELLVPDESADRVVALARAGMNGRTAESWAHAIADPMTAAELRRLAVTVAKPDRTALLARADELDGGKS